MKSPYISRVKIKNFRNFKDVDVPLSHKQVVIGENNVGKTNFLRALQLILDRELSERERFLDESDFHDNVANPMINGEEILIIVEIQGYDHNKKLVAQFQDAIVDLTPPTLRFQYRFFPNRNEEGIIQEYQFKMSKGPTEDKLFTHQDRNFINLKVINALRDVERELNSKKRSPLYQLVKLYEIDDSELDDISIALRKAAEEILELDEIKDIKTSLQEQFAKLSGIQKDKELSLRTFEIDPERLLYNLQVYFGIKERPISELSLGLANVLYLTIYLLLIKDRTIPPILKKDLRDKLYTEAPELIETAFETSVKENYLLKSDIDTNTSKDLYEFFDEKTFKSQSFTILAVEEPEAHLHPVLQRLIYREVLHKSQTSVIFTSHSPFISSVAPIESIVHCKNEQGETKVYSATRLKLGNIEKRDLERYLDAKRGEVYFGKGVIFVEGISEEYLVPKSAELLGLELDDFGIVICNVNSTNFFPYVQLAQILGIPWVLITDGDFYKIHSYNDTNGNQKSKKIFHEFKADTDPNNYLGHDILEKMFQKLGMVDEETPNDYEAKVAHFNSHGCFSGKYTLEVDLFEKGGDEGKKIIKKVFDEVKTKGPKQLKNFERLIDANNYWKALQKIEDTLGKGRFAQRLADHLIIDQVPDYITDAIKCISDKVKAAHE